MDIWRFFSGHTGSYKQSFHKQFCQVNLFGFDFSRQNERAALDDRQVHEGLLRLSRPRGLDRMHHCSFGNFSYVKSGILATFPLEFVTEKTYNIKF